MANVIGMAQLKSMRLLNEVAYSRFGDPVNIFYFNQAIDEYQRTKDIEILVFGLIASIKAGDTELSDSWFDEAMSRIQDMPAKIQRSFTISLYNKFCMDKMQILYEKGLLNEKNMNSITYAFLDVRNYLKFGQDPNILPYLSNFIKEEKDILFFEGCINILKSQFQNKVFSVVYEHSFDELGFGIFLYVNPKHTNRSQILDETIDMLDKWAKENNRSFSDVPFYIGVRSFNGLGTQFI